MFQFIVRRLLQIIPVLIGVTILVFSLMHLSPGNPAHIIAGESAPPATVEQIEERLGLNDPIPVQYFNFVKDAALLDFGNSWRTSLPVSEELWPKFWVTFELAVYSTIFSIFLGLIAGIISAVRKYSFADVSIMLIALFGLSMPNFWFGLMLMQWFSIQLGWLPPTGWGTPEQVIMPVITLGTMGAAVIARMTRSSMLDVISQDYIRTARAKGLGERIVIYRHALKNALIPVVTVIGLQFGSLLAGAVLTESVFAINGMGKLIVDRILARDFPVVQAAVLVIAVVFVFVNLLVDISYKYLNKRIDLD
ncbi:MULTISPECIES: ABC transporter permease [Virgibacillus]|uniref:Peptide ABC transporter permease n=1 Tax=Virgibacillus pantothenticus TaxID=1473 RepID=A0A0L0QM55_VIRPA|nr:MULTISPECIES: ABC transporter permease [Virgibacillus]API91606.1 peptide ABC transporter permease [Virgibacillus sp. 6R]KNE19353.1 peptide ABC transporter permease [Virgibacillus pantothenticus]MBS7426872.1 ABC transporter permease [Virgibacillus sp. 19R1-5]MBU8568319.1 ABC transporter permease [Virgibacillus pantothenticus]MBU8602224.1 ABC transporter permease [Virgibacillus pantothenticus]